MDDKAHVLEAYGAAIQLLFKVFFESYIAAQGNTEKECHAEQCFKGGVTRARHARDRALALLE
jgi:hypothetical protein